MRIKVNGEWREVPDLEAPQIINQEIKRKEYERKFKQLIENRRNYIQRIREQRYSSIY